MEIIVNHHLSIVRLAFVIVVFVMSVLTSLAQDDADEWLRVFTEDGSIIDINRLSLVLEHNQVIRAQFRTKFSKPQPIPGKSSIKYQTRLDSIQFSIKDRRYRISESNFLDASGKVALSFSSSGTNGWKPIAGRAADRLFSAAQQLQPFGVWTVNSYRYASGEPASAQDPPELTSLVGSTIFFSLDRVAAGAQTCHTPMFDPRTVTNEEFVHRIGLSLESLKLPSDKVDAILLGCNAEDKFPSQTIVLRLPGNKALMLWDGVFLELERSRTLFLP